MKVMFTLSHPAHVHLFRCLIQELNERGHETLVTSVEKEVSFRLLDAFNIPYIPIGKMKSSVAGKFSGLAVAQMKLLPIAMQFQPDLMVEGPGFPLLGPAGKILRIPVITFDDTEDAHLEHFLGDPLADTICTPSCYKTDLGKKQLRYRGYHELAYLHPSRFKPDPSVLDALRLEKGENLILIRFVSWGAIHDRGKSGMENKMKWIQELSKYGRVLITSENGLGKDLEKFQLKIPPEKLHDLLAFSTLTIGEGATVASESAVLGTHAIYINSLLAGVQQEEEKYGLVYCYPDPADRETRAMEKAVSLLQSPDLKAEGQRKREKLLSEKIDVTGFMVRLLEGYPDSIEKEKERSV